MTENRFSLAGQGWIWRDVLAPLLITRLALVWLAWLARVFPTSPAYPLADAAARGWQFTPYWLLDIWGRWDTGWYISMIRDGYVVRGDITQVQSNLAFFPLYPWLAQLALWLFPAAWRSDGVLLAAAVLVSNVLLVPALILLYKWVVAVTQDERAARRAIWYLLLFPTGFVLSAAYTETTFLFFVVATFYAATQRAWGWAGLAAVGVTLTRPLGVLIAPALLWLYLDAIQWRWRDLRANVLWIGAAPAAMLAYFYYFYLLTGDFWAPITVHASFEHSSVWPWTTILAPDNYSALTGLAEQIVIVAFLVLGVVACWRLPSAGYGLFALSQIVPTLFAGKLVSQLRYNMLAVVPFVLLALWGGRHPLLDRVLQVLFWGLQALYWVAWVRFYWVT